MNELTQKIVTNLSYQIIGAAIEVHKRLGPGLFEDVYETCMVWELEELGLKLKSIQEMRAVFEAQILTYMRLLQIPKGVLINFFCNNIFREGQKTFINDIYTGLPID